jgi:ParB family chromosome partitioning protein
MAFQGDSIYWVEVEKVVPNPFQPRREFDQNKLQELADSIRMYGVLQPLTVTRNEVQREDGTFYTEYELIAGERRLRASKLAGTAQVPVIIREGEQSEQEKLELAIIENLQREDLNAVDRAIAFKQLAEMFGLSHAQVAEKVQRSREYVSNSIRLLGLPENILDALKLGKMSEGHARTLLMLNDRPEEQDVIFREILLKKMSVREVERIVRKIATDKVRKKSAGDLDSNLIEYEKQFTETLGTRVQIQKTDFGGKLTIDYFSVEDLEGMLERMKKEAAELVPEQEAVDKLAEHTPLEQVRESQELPVQQSEIPVVPDVAPEPIASQIPHAVEQKQSEPETKPYSAAIHAVASVFQSREITSDPVSEPEPVKVPEQSAVEHSHQQVPEPVEVSAQPIVPDQTQEVLPDTIAESQPELQSVPEPEPAKAPEYQPFATRYATQSFQSNQAPSVPAVEPSQQQVPESEQAPTQPVVPAENLPTTKQPADDESSLYSIRNFNV